MEQTTLGRGLKMSHVVQALANTWLDNKGKWWTVTDLANFSTLLIQLAATPLDEAEQVEEDCICLVIELGCGTQVSMVEALYHNVLSWEPVAAATDEDIAEMVHQADPEQDLVEVECLQTLLIKNCNMFTPVLQSPGQACHKVHHIEVGGHWPIKVAPQ